MIGDSGSDLARLSERVRVSTRIIGLAFEEHVESGRADGLLEVELNLADATYVAQALGVDQQPRLKTGRRRWPGSGHAAISSPP